MFLQRETAMPNNFFISGMPKTGKTSILRNFVKKLESKGYCVGGFISPAIREHGTREGFYVEDIATGKTAPLASLSGGGPKISKYSINVKSFESIALECLGKDNLKKCDIIIIDEIGRMELESEKFADALENVLNGPTPVIASLHRDFVSKYSFFGKVYSLTTTNRNAIEIDVFDNVLQVLESKPKESKKLKEEFVEKKKIEKKVVVERKQEKKEDKKEQTSEQKKEQKKEEKKPVKEKVEKRITEKPKKEKIKETKKIEKQSEMEIEETESTKEPKKVEKKPEKKESLWDRLKKVFKR